MPSTRLQREAILSAAGETQGPIYELGAGWGSLAFALADRFPHAQVLAFEVSWVPFAVMRLRQTLRPRKNLSLHCSDFLRAPLADGQLFICYLFRRGMDALKSKLEREGALDARLVAHTFSVHGWKPESEATLSDLYRTPVYVYRLSAQRSVVQAVANR